MLDTNTLLAWGATYKQYQKGEYIFREDAPALFYHQVETGMVKMANCSEENREFIQGIFRDGESFGEPPLFYDGTYPAAAIAETSCTILRLRKDAFLQMLRESCDLLFGFTRLLSLRLKQKGLISKELACHDPCHRIRTILDGIKQQSLSSGFAAPVKVPYTRQQIADMTGLRVETVIRVIRSLEQKGELTIQGGKVYLANYAPAHMPQ